MTIDINIGGGLGPSKPQAKSLPYSEAKLVTPAMRNETFLLRNARAETIGPYKTDTVAYLKPKSKKGGKRKTKRRRHKSKRKTRSKKQKGGDLNSELIVASEDGDFVMMMRLLEQGADINQTNSAGDTPLYVASEMGNVEVVKILLEKGADINKANIDGQTPLMMAVGMGHEEVVEALLEYGANVNAKTNEGYTAFDMLYEDVFPEIATLLKTSQQKNVVTKNIKEYKRPNIPTLRSLAHSQLDTETTSEINKINDRLLQPGKLGGKRKTKRRRQKSKRKPRSKKQKGGMDDSDDTNTDDYDTDDNYYFENPNYPSDNSSQTLLMRAIEEERSENFIRRMITNENIDLNIPDKIFNRTALIYAISEQNYKIVKLLLENGADPNIKYSWMHLQSRLFKEDIDLTGLNKAYYELQDYSITALLIKHGADLTGFDTYAALKNASESGNCELIKALFEKMNINGDNGKQTPLMIVINNFDKDSSYIYTILIHILELEELDINYSVDVNDLYPKTALDEVQRIINLYRVNTKPHTSVPSAYKMYKKIEKIMIEKGAKNGKDLVSNKDKLIYNIEYKSNFGEEDRLLSTITIPKGTILFRRSEDINSDYCGYPVPENRYLTHQDNNVFFYFYPYYADIIDATDNMTDKMFYLTKDIQLLNLTYPSEINRGDKYNDDYEDIFSTCSDKHSDLTEYDPCLANKFMKFYPDIMGFLAIAETDSFFHKRLYYNENNSEKDEALFYSVLWGDKENEGAPEVILHPFQKRIKEDYSEGGLVQSIEDCENLPKNYELLEESNKENSIVSILNEYLRPEGKNNKHITIFNPLKLFVLYEELDDKYKKSCVPLIMDIKSKLQTFQITRLYEDDMVPFYRVEFSPDINRNFNETIFKNRNKQKGGKSNKIRKTKRRRQKSKRKPLSKKQKNKN